MSLDIVSEYESMQSSCIVLSRIGFKHQDVLVMYAPHRTPILPHEGIVIVSFANYKILLDEKIFHVANLQLDVCILNIDNRSQRLCLWFLDPAEQATLHELEFENPDPGEPTSDEKTRERPNPSPHK